MQKVVLAGASNLKYSIAYFDDPALFFTDLSTPGWVPTPGNVTALRDSVHNQVSENVSAFVFDLFGNTSVCFEQFDGSTSLPFKSHGKFHLGGNVVVSQPEVFKKIVEEILPILHEKGNTPSVIVPPIPRYLFSRCCSDPGHYTNASKTDHCENLLTGFLQQRNNFIKILVSAGVKNFKVLDACCTTTCVTTANTETRIADLKQVTAQDGIHCVAAGYWNLVMRCLACLRTLLAEPPRSDKAVSHFWRGFKSSKGSKCNTGTRVAHFRGRGAAKSARGSFPKEGFHPYRRN